MFFYRAFRLTYTFWGHVHSLRTTGCPHRFLSAFLFPRQVGPKGHKHVLRQFFGRRVNVYRNDGLQRVDSTSSLIHLYRRFRLLQCRLYHAPTSSAIGLVGSRHQGLVHVHRSNLSHRHGAKGFSTKDSLSREFWQFSQVNKSRGFYLVPTSNAMLHLPRFRHGLRVWGVRVFGYLYGHFHRSLYHFLPSSKGLYARLIRFFFLPIRKDWGVVWMFVVVLWCYGTLYFFFHDLWGFFRHVSVLKFRIVSLVGPLFNLVGSFIVGFLPQRMKEGLVVRVTRRVVGVNGRLFRLHGALLVYQGQASFPRNATSGFQYVLSDATISPNNYANSQCNVRSLFYIYGSTVLFFRPNVLPSKGLYLFSFLCFVHGGQRLSNTLLNVREQKLPLFFRFPMFLVANNGTLFFFSRHIFYVNVRSFRVFLSKGGKLILVLSIGVSRRKHRLFWPKDERYFSVSPHGYPSKDCLAAWCCYFVLYFCTRLPSHVRGL